MDSPWIYIESAKVLKLKTAIAIVFSSLDAGIAATMKGLSILLSLAKAFSLC